MEVRVARRESPKDKELAVKAASILKASFKVTEQWIEVFLLLAKNRGMSGEEVFQCVVKAVDRITFSSPTPAEVLGDSEAIKLYTYREVEYLVHQGKHIWKDFGIVRFPDGNTGIIFGKVTDMISVGIPILQPKRL